MSLHVCADLDAAEHAQAHVLMEERTFSTLVKMQNFNRVDLFARYLFFFSHVDVKTKGLSYFNV